MQNHRCGQLLATHQLRLLSGTDGRKLCKLREMALARKSIKTADPLLLDILYMHLRNAIDDFYHHSTSLD